MKKKTREYLFVDGYNIINDWEDLKKKAEIDLEGARNDLLEMLVEYHHMTRIEIILVFDAHMVKSNNGKEYRYKGIKCIYTKEKETADHYIEKNIDKIGKTESVVVATSDWLEQQIVLARGATRISARELKIEIQKVKEEINRKKKYMSKKNNKSINTLDEKLIEKLNKWSKKD